MNASPTTATHPAFQTGAPVVVLYQGLYNGMPGRFVGPRNDPNWADIEERFGSVRAHPVVWLRRPEDVQDLTASLSKDLERLAINVNDRGESQ